MSEEENKAATPESIAARTRVVARMNENRMSIITLAGVLGLGKTALSLWINDKYTGDNDKILYAVEGWLARESDRIEKVVKDIPFVDTDTSRRICELAMMCHTEGEIAVAYGDSGVGKTTSGKWYAKNNPGSIFIEADMGYTPKTLFGVIATELGLQATGTINDVFENIRKRLTGTGRVVIVDEAEHLSYKSLELLRRLHDKAGIGILLIGMPRLLANLRGSKGEYAQLFSRVVSALKMGNLTKADTARMVRSVIEVGDSVINSIHEQSGGNARRMVKMLKVARKICRVNGCAMDVEVVKRAAGMLMV